MSSKKYSKKKASWPIGPPGQTSISIGPVRFKGNMWAVCVAGGVFVAGVLILTSWVSADQVITLLSLFV